MIVCANCGIPVVDHSLALARVCARRQADEWIGFCDPYGAKEAEAKKTLLELPARLRPVISSPKRV